MNPMQHEIPSTLYRRMSITAVLFCGLVFGYCCSSLGEDEPSLAASIFEGWAGNVEAIKSYEVYEEYEQMAHDPKLGIESTTVKSLCFVDFDSRECSVRRLVEAERPKADRTVCTTSWYLEDGKGYSTDCRGNKSKIGRGLKAVAPYRFEFNDYRNVGSGEFNTRMPKARLDLVKAMDQVYHSSNDFKWSRNGDKGSIVKTSEGPVFTWETHWEFDLINLVPLSRKAYSIHNETKKRHLMVQENYRWIEVGGIMLPKSIAGQKLRLSQDRITQFTDHYTHQLRWSLLNDESVENRSWKKEPEDEAGKIEETLELVKNCLRKDSLGASDQKESR